jgi:broad specificity phosphatase PhoE
VADDRLIASECVRVPPSSASLIASLIRYDLLGRVDELKRWILTRPETTIAVVGHGGLFSRILGYHLKNCGFKWHDVGP